MSFPLFRLPEVALEEVLKKFNPKEILILTQTSLRTRHRISRHRKSYSVEIRVVRERLESYVNIINTDRKFFRINIHTWVTQFDSSWRFHTIVPVRYEKDALVSFWTQKDIAFQEILDFLNEIFRIKEVSFNINRKSSDSAVHILEHCASKNLKIGSVDWPSFSGDKEVTEKILMASKGASHLNIRVFTSSSMRFDHFHLFRMDLLEMEFAWWMTVENIVSLRNCKRIRLKFLSFTTLSLKQIFREYLKNPGELCDLRINIDYCIRMEQAIEGLNVVRVEEGNDMRGSKYWFSGHNGVKISATMMDWNKTVVIKREF
uniref:F-box domain-containing protein n=1 Tax=Caenorhabditis tropicalis TaxID=1561998 RepID=A0A1I7UT55_9PELO